MSDLLAVGAHPDDVEIFAGGTLACFARLGWTCHILHLTRGELGTRGTPELRKREATAAAAELGATMEILDLGDGALCDDERSRRAVIEVIRRERPRLLIGPHPLDDHPDHEATGRIVKAAWYLAGITRAGAGRDPHRPPGLWFYPSHEHFDASLIVPLTRGDVDALVRAVRCYGSQFHDPASTEPATRLTRPGFFDSLVGRRQFFGSRIDASHGEAFRTHWPLALPDPTRLFS